MTAYRYSCSVCHEHQALAVLVEVRPCVLTCLTCLRRRDAVRDGHAARTNTAPMTYDDLALVTAWRRSRETQP